MTLDAALRLGRISNVPTVWTNVAAAAVLAGAPMGRSVGAVALACSLFYLGGMFLNDAFDRAFDAHARPERPIPSGAVGAGEVFVCGFALLGGGLVAIALIGRIVLGDAANAIAAGAALAAAIVAYDVWHKRNPGAPVLMGVCRMLVYVATAATLTGTVPGSVVAGGGVLLCYLIGLTYTARFETAGAVRNVWPLACLAMPFVFWSPAGAGALGVLLYGGAAAWVLGCVAHLGWRSRVDVPRAVVGMIAGIALVDALAMASVGSLGPALFALGCFGLTLGLQRWVPGT
jgi:4-hydroxybenzoate polyprenyltransferase